MGIVPPGYACEHNSVEGVRAGHAFGLNLSWVVEMSGYNAGQTNLLFDDDEVGVGVRIRCDYDRHDARGKGGRDATRGPRSPNSPRQSTSLRGFSVNKAPRADFKICFLTIVTRRLGPRTGPHE